MERAVICACRMLCLRRGADATYGRREAPAHVTSQTLRSVRRPPPVPPGALTVGPIGYSEHMPRHMIAVFFRARFGSLACVNLHADAATRLPRSSQAMPRRRGEMRWRIIGVAAAVRLCWWYVGQALPGPCVWISATSPRSGPRAGRPLLRASVAVRSGARPHACAWPAWARPPFDGVAAAHFYKRSDAMIHPGSSGVEVPSARWCALRDGRLGWRRRWAALTRVDAVRAFGASC